MEQKDIVVGFSDLKDRLIRVYGIDRSRDEIRLYFTINEGQLLMHDYSDHKKQIAIASFKNNLLPKDSPSFRLVNYVIRYENSQKLLNELFQLYGFFRF